MALVSGIGGDDFSALLVIPPIDGEESVSSNCKFNRPARIDWPSQLESSYEPQSSKLILSETVVRSKSINLLSETSQ